MANRFVILSPPFYSHFQPLLELGRRLREQGCPTVLACTPEFREAVLAAGLEFYPLALSRNRNTGNAEATRQDEAERRRLLEFFQATRQGPVETLITQLRHRRGDTLGEPEKLLEELREADRLLQPQWWIADLLSYGATLCLHALGLPYLTFCPPHPRSIPAPGAPYNIPPAWPLELAGELRNLPLLEAVSKETEEAFTRTFNAFLQKVAPDTPPIASAFRLLSPEGILYLYPDFYQEENLQSGPRKLYLGSAFREEEPLALPPNAGPSILITLGTFLSERADVLEKLIQGALEAHPQARVFAAVGEHEKELAHLASPRLQMEAFLPQKALLPSMDLVIHHGGCNTFTETLYYEKPMVILPFSSDQFNIARDAGSLGLAVILSPNASTREEVREGIRKALSLDRKPLAHWSAWLRKRGASYGAAILRDLPSPRKEKRP